eukprot:TRINITY_DN44355_c0_g1_i1.p1 TRINITY_DN44355_c0_g1~~TRINITY_DN44355_c0_g1_i1.p1  ORF type:complete len:1083 (+),score=291.28 TRINITY_DN44355_c0_g1_i1:235-3483(+)
MLKRFVASRLRRYVKGFDPKQISAKLLSGKFKLYNVELDVEAIAALLVGQLPYTIEIRRVFCKTVSAKVPWKNLRQNPISVELDGLEVVIVVHDAKDEEWLKRQTAAQREQLKGKASSVAASKSQDDELDEEEEEQKEIKDVKAQLKVGLQNVVVDGLCISLSNISVVLKPATVSAPLGFALQLQSLSALPCSSTGAQVKRPEDVYEPAEKSVLLHRAIEVAGFAVTAVPAVAPATPLPPLVSHVDDVCGPLKVLLQQRRQAGFIPRHKTRRVCPFSSEANASVTLGRLALTADESHIASIVSLVAAAVSPPYVPVEALPSHLQHLHWQAAASSPVAPPARRASPAHAWSPPARQPENAASGFLDSSFCAATPTSTRGRPSIAAAVATEACKWSQGMAAVGAVQGLEIREHFIERALTRWLELRVEILEIGVLVTSSGGCQTGDVAATSGGACTVSAEVAAVRFARDMVFVLEPFEHRCLVQLGLVEKDTAKTMALSSPSASQTASAARMLPSSPTSSFQVPMSQQAAALHIQRVARGYLVRKRLGAGKRSASAAPSRQASLESLSPSSRVGSKGATPPGTPQKASRERVDSDSAAVFGESFLDEALLRALIPAAQQPELCINVVTVHSATVRWSPFLAQQGLEVDRPLVDLRRSGAQPALTFRWKEVPHRSSSNTSRFTEPQDIGWQPMEGCVHGAQVTLDIEGLQRIAKIGQNCVGTALDGWDPPELECGWLRLALHGTSLSVPLGLKLPQILVQIPSTLVTSATGLCELFCALGAVPPASWPAAASNAKTDRAESASTSAAAAGSQAREQSTAGAKRTSLVDAMVAARDCACPCGRVVGDGSVRVGSNFVPARARHTGRAWAVQQRSAGAKAAAAAGFVAVSQEELMELMKAKVGSEAMAGVSEELNALWTADDDGSEAAELEEADAGNGMNEKKEKKRRGFLGFGRKSSSSSSKKDPKVATSTAAGAFPVGASAAAAAGKAGSQGSAEDLAKRWAALRETLRRLRLEKEEVDLRCKALRAAARGEVSRAEAKAVEREQTLAGKISEERLKQAELAAKAEEQQKALDRLLRGLPPGGLR